jgi:hypothetical protein
MNGDVVEVEAEEMPLGDVLVELEAERNKKERKAKRAVVAALSARGLQPGRRLGGDIDASHVDDVEASDSMAWRGLLLFDKNGKPRSSPGNVLKVLEHLEHVAR